MMHTKAWTWLSLVSALIVFGCSGGDGASSGGDSGTDAVSEFFSDVVALNSSKPDSGGSDSGPDVGTPDVVPGPDTAPDVISSDVVLEVAPEAVLDDAPDDMVLEVAPEAVLDDAPDDMVLEVAPDVIPDVEQDAPIRPSGQCNSNADCVTAMSVCAMSAPGGTCIGCGSFSECGDGDFLKWDCVSGACVRRCSIDTDCPIGFRCSGGTGRCSIIACKNGCPAPYVCNAGGSYCGRPKCASSDPRCPADMTCGQENYCVEKK